MPFKNVKVCQSQMSFEEVDRIICARVFPNFIQEQSSHILRYYIILPNGKPSLFLDEAGSMKSKNPKEYFALLCLEVGLQYSDIGLWLDECIMKYTRKHIDGITRVITVDKESRLRFDNRKPVYHFNGESRRYLFIRQNVFV